MQVESALGSWYLALRTVTAWFYTYRLVVAYPAVLQPQEDVVLVHSGGYSPQVLLFLWSPAALAYWSFTHVTYVFKPGILTTTIVYGGVCVYAGGVAVSGLEMAQNATMTTWSSADVDDRLKVRHGLEGGCC